MTRVESLGRLVGHMWAACENARANRASNPAGLDKAGLALIYEEFNWAASQLNQFPMIEAPSDRVSGALIKYRSLCGSLSGALVATSPTTSELLTGLTNDMLPLRQIEADLLAEAKRLTTAA